jgi:hypothetical protein
MDETEQVRSSRELYVLKEEGNHNPASIANRNTAVAVAAGTCGAQPGGKRGYVDAVEIVNGHPKRITTWILDGRTRLEFRPAFAAEEITVGEFVKRFNSREWCEANPDHPIAYLHWYAENFRTCLAKVKERKPGKMVRRGRRWLLIEEGCPPVVAQKFKEDFYGK